MSWSLNNDRPIYLQLAEILTLQILSGEYPPGSRLPSVRELSVTAGVTPNTMQKAFAELEHRELVFTQRTAGRTVTEDKTRLEEVRSSLAQEQIRLFVQKMQELGYTRDALPDLLNTYEQS